MRSRVVAFLIAASVWSSPVPSSSQERDTPLPDLQSFARDVPAVILATIAAGELTDDKTIPFEAAALRHFVYTEKETWITLDSKGNEKKKEINVYEVTRGPEEWRLYRRQISRNGTPLTQKELQQQDREQRKREQKQRQTAEKETEQRTTEPEAPPDNPAPQTEQDDMVRLFFGLYDINLVAREIIDGNPTVLLTFRPKPGVKINGDILKLLHRVSLRAWITEKDHEVVRVECTVVEPISFGVVLARIHPGSTLVLDRSRIKDGIWAPSRIEFTARGRLLLFKRLHERGVTEYYDFKESSVETILNAGDHLSFQP